MKNNIYYSNPLIRHTILRVLEFIHTGRDENYWNETMLFDSQSLVRVNDRSVYDRFIYCLIDDLGEIVYVGRTRNIQARLSFHRATKSFSSIFLFRSDSHFGAAGMERDLIRNFNPKYNIALTERYGKR